MKVPARLTAPAFSAGISFLALLFAAQSVRPVSCFSADDPDVWPGFRGPNGCAVSEATTVPTRFSEKDFNWKIALPGKGHSSPAIWNGTIFLTASESDQTRYVLAFSTKDGRELWRWNDGFTAHNKNKLNEFASSSPCADKDRIYVFWTSGTAAEALALTHSGSVAWRQALGSFHGDHGSASSPVLASGVLFVFWDDLDKGQTEYAGLNPMDGKFLWRKTLPWPIGQKGISSYSTPAVRTSSKGQAEVIVSTMPFGVQSFDPRTGSLLWHHDQRSRFRTVGSPVVADRVIFVAWGSGTTGAQDHVALFPGTETASGKPEIAWRRTKPSGSPDNKGLPYVPTPLAHQGLLYFWTEAGLLQVVQARTGKVVYGPENIGGRYLSSPILIGDHVYCANRDQKEIVVVKAGPKFEMVSRNPIGAGMSATPAVAQGTMFLRTDTDLVSLGGRPK